MSGRGGSRACAAPGVVGGWSLRAAFAGVLLSVLVGCGGPYADVPDQTQFAPLEELAASGEAVVRLYAAPTPGFELIAIHPWFAVKSAEATAFERWEVWPEPSEPYGHVRVNMLPADADVGTGEPFVLAELSGPAAESVLAFIVGQSPRYPFRDAYQYFPGPNSNTYAQWVLDNTGWAVSLPPAAIGWGAGFSVAACPAVFGRHWQASCQWHPTESPRNRSGRRVTTQRTDVNY